MERWEAKGEEKKQTKEEDDEEEEEEEKLIIRKDLAKKRVKEGPSTPVLPSWRIQHLQQQQQECETEQDDVFERKAPSLSARKLAAFYWEQYSEQQSEYYSAKMNKGISGNHNDNPPQPRRLRRLHDKKDKEVDRPTSYLDEPSPSFFPDQPDSASSLKRHIAASLMQHHQSMDVNKHSLQSVSPASYSSSVEMARYNPAITPTSSMELKSRMGDSSYSFKTSTELLKVLNRIWSLEEQHSCNVSLIKALKTELTHARMKINDLIQEHQSDRQEMEELMKQIAEEKLVRKSKEQDRIISAVQSVREELENERQLRKRSESLHRRFARELLEAKSSCSSSQQELETERKTRLLLEDLCDEFAKGIKDYEQEVHALRQKSENDLADETDPDRMILHISESWLDERTQLKLRGHPSGSEKSNSVAEKIRPELETFIQAKQFATPRGPNKFSPKDSKESRMRRISSESVPLIDAISAPQDVGDEDSDDADSQCFELNKPCNDNSRTHEDEDKSLPSQVRVKSDHTKKKHGSHEKIKHQNTSSFQFKFKEQMARAVSCNGNKAHSVDPGPEDNEEGKPAEISITRKSEIYDIGEQVSNETHNRHNRAHRSNPNHIIDGLLRSHHLFSEGNDLHPEGDTGETSHGNGTWRTRRSPIRQWMSKLTHTTDLDTPEPYSKSAQGSKENTLKAKLLEARTKGHRKKVRASNGYS